MRGQPIEVVIEEQNVPRPIEHWSNSSIMLPTRYLAAMVYYFVYGAADPRKNVTNKGIMAIFKLSSINLHKLVSGKKYHGGSHGKARKARSVAELEEHGEKMVQVNNMTVKPGTSKAGGGSKGVVKKSKVTVTKTAIMTLKIIPLPLLEETLALGMRNAKKRKEDP